MENKKTIFITSFFGLIARNILDTDVLKILSLKENLSIVVLAPAEKKESYEERFGGTNVKIEGLNFKKPSRKESFLAALFLNALDTDSRRICRFTEAKQHNRWVGFIFWTLIAKLSRFSFFRRFLRWLDYRFSDKENFSNLFQKYSPDMVFSTDIFEPHDVIVIREAKKRGIPILGMVRSWDNITTHGLNRFIPGSLVVNTPSIKNETVKYNDIEPKDIFVSGIPHYDKYIKHRNISKEELFKKLNLDPSKKTVFFAPTPNIFSKDNPVNPVAIKKLLDLDVQLILRLYFVGDVNLGAFKAVPGKIAIDAPSESPDSLRSDLRVNDKLADLLYHSDVVVAFASTLAVDAVVFGKPVVFIGFDGAKNYPYWKSLRRFYDFDHQKSLLNTGGIKLATNPDDFSFYIKDYLANPDLDKEGRQRIVQEKCWKLDGGSGRRLAEYIISRVK
ncbi:MAG: CDP-glycerol glycerophosphotransferase family protein [Minisyncoccia bacterium]